MLKELFPEETHSQNSMGNMNSPQPTPQSIPQEASFDINQPIKSGVYSQPETIQPESTAMKFNVHASQDNAFDVQANNLYDNSSNNTFNNVNDYNINNHSTNNYNINNYATQGIGDYKKHAASDIKWKRLISVEVITSLLFCILPIVIIMVFLMVGQKSVNTATSIMSILSLIASFITAGLVAVVIQNFLDVKRHKNDGMFKGFTRLLPLWITRLLIGLMIIGSFILPVIPLIILGVNHNETLFKILISFALIGMSVLDVWIILRYSLTQYLVVDGKSSIEAMRTSKKLMAGHKLQFLGLVLSFIGWYLLFYVTESVLYTIFMSPLSGEFNLVGLLLGWFLMGFVAYILILPLNIYFNMTIAEFYEDRVNNGLNELRVTKKGKPILITLILSVLLTVISTGLMFLPGPKTSLQSLVYQVIPILESYGLEFNGNIEVTDPNNFGIGGLNEDINIPDDPNTGGDVDINDNGGDTDLDVLGNGLAKLNYSVPSGYTQSYVSNNYISYADADWNDITLTYEEDYFDLKNYEDIYPGGEYKSIAGHDAYVFLYSFDDSDYKEYTCYLKGTKEDDGYYIRAEKEDAFNYVINSLNF